MVAKGHDTTQLDNPNGLQNVQANGPRHDARRIGLLALVDVDTPADVFPGLRARDVLRKGAAQDCPGVLNSAERSLT